MKQEPSLLSILHCKKVECKARSLAPVPVSAGPAWRAMGTRTSTSEEVSQRNENVIESLLTDDRVTGLASVRPGLAKTMLSSTKARFVWSAEPSRESGVDMEVGRGRPYFVAIFVYSPKAYSVLH